jgi:lipid-A-disaccharide synthase
MKDVVRDCSQTMDQRTIRDRLDLSSGRYCLFLPGSKPALIRYLIRFYIDLVQHIKKDQPDFKAALLISSFISPELIIDLSSQYDLCLADLVVTVPGSLTAISAYLKVPVIMLLPLDSADAIIYHGPVGRLLRLPHLGRLTLSVVRFILARRKKWFALPNTIASKEIIPEIVGKLHPDAVATYVSRIFFDPVKLAEMRNRLRDFDKQQDNLWPSRTILEYILDR